MFKLVWRLALGLVICLGSALALAESRSCPIRVLQKDQVKTVVDRRQTTFKHCLACQGDQCRLKRWPEEGEQFADACKLLFCTPTKMPQKMFLPYDVEEKAGIFFRYGINKQGRVKDVEITELFGDISDEMAREMIRDYFERRRYEPIVIDGETYELNGLRDGTNYKIRWRL